MENKTKDNEDKCREELEELVEEVGQSEEQSEEENTHIKSFCVCRLLRMSVCLCLFSCNTTSELVHSLYKRGVMFLPKMKFRSFSTRHCVSGSSGGTQPLCSPV